jgi:hypothetical protein
VEARAAPSNLSLRGFHHFVKTHSIEWEKRKTNFQRRKYVENQAHNNNAQEAKQPQGLYVNPDVFLTKQNTLVHAFGGMRIEMHVNFYKKLLGIPFQKAEPTDKPANSRPVYGLIIKPNVFIRGNYLVHTVLGIRVSKHINFYKAVLSPASKEAAASDQMLLA